MEMYIFQVELHHIILPKYSNAGTLLWTYSIPNTWSGTGGFGSKRGYSKFCVIHSTGSVLYGEGFNRSGNQGPRVMKLTSVVSTNYFSCLYREL